MAQRRMLSKRISQSKKVNALRLKTQIVYTWTIPWLDDYGCYTGDPEDIKTEVLPKNKKISTKDIEAALTEATQAELIIWYTFNGKLVQQYQNFDSFQTFKGDRERKSDYPQYQPENEICVPVGNQRIPKPSLNLTKGNLTKDKHGEFVELSTDEYKKLTGLYGEQLIGQLIAELNDYIGSSGKRYKSHYYTLRNWARRKNIPVLKPKPKPPEPEKPVKVATLAERQAIAKQAGLKPKMKTPYYGKPSKAKIRNDRKRLLAK